MQCLSDVSPEDYKIFLRRCAAHIGHVLLEDQGAVKPEEAADIIDRITSEMTSLVGQIMNDPIRPSAALEQLRALVDGVMKKPAGASKAADGSYWDAFAGRSSSSESISKAAKGIQSVADRLNAGANPPKREANPDHFEFKFLPGIGDYVTIEGSREVYRVHFVFRDNMYGVSPDTKKELKLCSVITLSQITSILRDASHE